MKFIGLVFFLKKLHKILIHRRQRKEGAERCFSILKTLTECIKSLRVGSSHNSRLGGGNGREGCVMCYLCVEFNAQRKLHTAGRNRIPTPSSLRGPPPFSFTADKCGTFSQCRRRRRPLSLSIPYASSLTHTFSVCSFHVVHSTQKPRASPPIINCCFFRPPLLHEFILLIHNRYKKAVTRVSSRYVGAATAYT